LTERGPNKICPVCKRKSLAPEKSGGRWYFPPKKICYNCVEFLNNGYDKVNANRRILVKTVKESEAIFPLTAFDRTENTYLGKFNDFESLRKELKEYTKTYPASDIRVIDDKYHNFADFFKVYPYNNLFL
jgi:hypothetical protein